MGKDKLKRFAENKIMENVIEPSIKEVLKEDNDLKGKWCEYFGNENPIVLELACGKGEYTVGMARKYPEKNFIGIDIKGARMWRGAKTSIEDGMSNVTFLRTRIEFIDRFFKEDEVSEIWITFADPHKKKRNAKHRLTHPFFLDKYKPILKKEGTVNLKSDSTFLTDFTFDVIHERGLKVHCQTLDVYGFGKQKFNDELNDILSIRTFYEKRWIEEGKKIKFIKFSL
ncbi:MAG: tRNA (guanosine(46)-N7)-methyltransferase TrmB [Flavobacteriales bacterium]|nr:tRNA (guanosine(46)-N7)-methyltransferase TrmB [Flavobacteriales bacterium]